MDVVVTFIMVLASVILWFKISNEIKIKIRRNREEHLRALDIASVDYMDGISFEYYVAWLLKHKGYSSVRVTQGSNDYGADIIATKNDKKYSSSKKIFFKCFTSCHK